MALKTWSYKVGQFGTINAKGLKADVENLMHYGFSPIVSIRQYHTEITGIIGGEEHRSTMMTLFGGGAAPLADEEGYKTAMDNLFASLPNPIIDLQGTLEKCQEIFKAHCPVVDNRKTQEQVAQENAEYLEAKAANEERAKQERAFWLSKYSDGENTNKITIPQGMMAVCCQATYNDSDSMSDYFAPHRSIGPAFLLAIVPIQPQTERLFREIAEKYPDLQTHMSWHTENYSGGHGNYLMSGGIGSVPEQAYNGREEVVYCLEIQANKYAGGRSEGYYPFRGYTNTPMVGMPTAGAAGGGEAGEVSYKLNPEKNGVEIRFSKPPADNTISTLHCSGFRWSRFQKLWYAKQSEKTIQVAQRICQSFEQAAARA